VRLKGGKRRKYLMIVDTGVLIEYINEAGTYHEKVKKLIESYTPLYVTPITLSEVLYVSYRVYITAELSNANNYAKEFVEWLSTKLKVTEINHEIVIKAGEIKKKYGIALPDCYVIATADYLKDKALFKREKEIVQVLDEIRKEFGDIISFINEI